MLIMQGIEMKKHQIYSDQKKQGFFGFPNAIKCDGLVFTSGVRPSPTNVDRSFSELPENATDKQQGFSLVDKMESQVCFDAWHTHAALESLLNLCNSNSTQILRQHMWQKDKRFFPAYENIRKKVQEVPAPSSGVGVETIFGDDFGTIGIDAIAVCLDEDSNYPKREVITKLDDKKLPSAGFYSQAVKTGDLVFTAGHIPIKTSTKGKPVVMGFEDIPEEGRFLATGRSHPDSRDGPIAAQAWYTYNELKRTLESHGLELSDTINSTVYLTDIRDFAVFHRIHEYFFPNKKPALSVIGFSEVGHRGCLIEIELTAVKRNKDKQIENVEWPIDAPFNAPAATVTNGLIFYSGMCGYDNSGSIIDSLNNPSNLNLNNKLNKLLQSDRQLFSQTWLALDTLKKVANKAGSSIDDLLKISIYLQEKADFETFANIFAEFVQKDKFPALECVIIPNPAPDYSARIQIEAIGFK